MKARPRHSNSLRVAAVALAAGLLGSTALGQPQPSQPDPTDLPPASKLIEVPVTGLVPGPATQPDMKNPVESDPGAASRGKNYFTAFNCVGCHADNGGGGMGPALSNKNFVYGGAPAQIYLSIAQGRPNGMPAWGSRVPPQVIWDIVTYVQQISREPHEGWGATTSLDAFDVEQAPAQSEAGTDPWQNTRPFSFGQNPDRGDAPSN